jgi:hypothetical protein
MSFIYILLKKVLQNILLENTFRKSISEAGQAKQGKRSRASEAGASEANIGKRRIMNPPKGIYANFIKVIAKHLFFYSKDRVTNPFLPFSIPL